ncbi:unnamed protein product, partial [Symbiodinium sp. CCMP2456]
MAPSILFYPALCFAVAADEPLLLRLGQSMDRFYAEHRHHAFRQRLEKHPRFASPAGSDAVAGWQAWLRRCSDEACSCNAVPVEGANGVLREPCDCAPLPSSVGQIGRTLRLGRVLWCIAAAGDVSVAADFYANEGGSASLLAHGLSQHPAPVPRRLWTFEVQADWAASTARSLQAAGADVSLVKPAWSGSAAQEALLKEARGGEPRASVRAIVVAEAPAFHHDASEEAASEALLQAPCMEKPGIQFAFIDPLEAFVPEFSILFTSCPDLKWIAVHNTNLQQMTGWIPRFLANRTGWHLVLQGSHVWRPVELTRHVPRRRAWQIWARGDALQGAPLHSLAGDGQDAEVNKPMKQILFSGYVNPCRYLEVHRRTVGINSFVEYPGAEDHASILELVQRFCGHPLAWQPPWWFENLQRRRLASRYGQASCSGSLRSSAWRTGSNVADLLGDFESVSVQLILAKIPIYGYFVNLGAADGVWSDPLMSFTRKGARGVAVEMDPQACARYRRNFPHVNLLCTRLTMDTIPELAKQVEFGGYDVLKVDVDSYDCALVRELLMRFHHRPSCILLEVNSAFPPPFEFAMEPHSAWDSLDPKLVRYHLAHGCSLSYAIRMLSDELPGPKYVLLHMSKKDALFLRADVAAQLLGSDEAPDEFRCYEDQLLETHGVESDRLRRWYYGFKELTAGADIMTEEEVVEDMREVVRRNIELVFGRGLATMLPFQLTFRRQDVAPMDANFLMDSAKRVYSLVHDLGRNYLVFRDMVDTT